MESNQKKATIIAKWVITTSTVQQLQIREKINLMIGQQTLWEQRMTRSEEQAILTKDILTVKGTRWATNNNNKVRSRSAIHSFRLSHRNNWALKNSAASNS